MIWNYFQVAVRNLRRHRFFSAINIFGLAVSMSICLGIMMLVADQLTYDRHNTKRDRVYRVLSRNMNPDGSPAGNDYATAPQPLAKALTEDYTGVAKTVRLRRGFGNGWLELEPGRDLNIPVSGFFADPDVLDVFEYALAHGDPATALNEPYSVVITKKVAQKLFKTDNAIGEVITVGDIGDYKVTGVLADTHHKSHIVFDALASYATVTSLEADSTFSAHQSGWDNFTSGWVYLLAAEGVSPEAIQGHLASIAGKQQKEADNGQQPLRLQYRLQNISDITPGPFVNNAIGPFMPKIFVYFFAGLALIIMVTSCFNYANLSIARSLTRAREIGVRKVNGATRRHIVVQFMAEAVVISLLSLALALLFLVLVKPFMLTLKFAQALHWDLEGNIYVYAAFVAFSVLVGMVAGIVPASMLSRFQPVKVLKGVGGMKLFSRVGLRKALLVVQFSLSLIFILSVLLLYNQLQLFVKADHGFRMADKINVQLGQTDSEQLRTALGAYPNITSVSAASHIPAAGVTYGDDFKKLLTDTESRLLDYFAVDANYLENMGLSLAAGRNFSHESGADNKWSIILNETAVKRFQLGSPHEAVGSSLFRASDSAEFRVIGVVKDYHHQMMMQQLEPMALRFDSSAWNVLQVAYRGDREDAIRNIEAAWSKVNPGLLVNHRDFEDEIMSFYHLIFSDFVRIVGVIAFLAVLVSCLGLLGMATYATETRLKEVSIRKVLGSTEGALVMLLSKGFFVLLAIAVCIALPAAWAINNLWLELIAYHVRMTTGVIAAGVGIVTLLGVITIGSQTLRAAFSNPARALRND